MGLLLRVARRDKTPPHIFHSNSSIRLGGRASSRKVPVQIEFLVPIKNIISSFAWQKEAKPKACDHSPKNSQ
jgi:hypothetical protein